MVQFTGGFTPVCVNVTEYAVPTRPPGTVVGLMTIVGHTIVSDGATEPLHPAASVAVTVKLNVPAWNGTPPSVPAAPSWRPDGRLPDDTVKVCGGIPLAANVWR
jgi:hypothetical protein